jgi:hypothetical protein
MKYTDWEPHRAWTPVKVHGQWVWLKKVYRRIRYEAYKPIDVEYGTLFDVLKEESTLRDPLVNPETGQMWYDAQNGVTKVYNGTQWIIVL